MSNLYPQVSLMVFADTDGTVQSLDIGKSDNGVPIYYEVETQEIDFGDRSHLKKVSDRIGILNEFDSSSELKGRANDNDYQDIPMNMNERVSIGKDINLEGNFFTFKWSGNVLNNSPVFDGLYIESLEDMGINTK